MLDRFVENSGKKMILLDERVEELLGVDIIGVKRDQVQFGNDVHFDVSNSPVATEVVLEHHHCIIPTGALLMYLFLSEL